MRVLYGVVGEGMGHATRSRVILEHLLAKGHELHIVVSGRAHKFLTDKLGARERVVIHEIEGLNLKFEGNDLDVAESILLNLEKAPTALTKNVDVMRKVLEGFEPHLSEACVGSVSEIFDAEPPFTPRGCVAQAWSVAEVLRAWLRCAAPAYQ